MTTSAPATRRTAVGARVPATTPQLMRRYGYGIVVTALALLGGAEATIGGVRHAIKTIGTDSAPSIIAAQEIGSRLADLDANAINYLLTLGSASDAKKARDVFEADRVAVTERLVGAAENITFGDLERRPLMRIFEGLGRYLEICARSRLRADQGDARGALADVNEATSLMHTTLLPAANELDTANGTYMDEAYERQRTASVAEIAFGVGLTAALVAILVAAQVFLWRRTKRVVNIPLAAATLVSLGFGLYLLDYQLVARADLREAKTDAFDSIHTLWRARSIAADANGDESRMLVDPAHGLLHRQAFDDRVAELTSRPALAASDAGDLLRRTKVPMQGLFATELNNITFEGERPAAVEMVTKFANYYAVDRQIRALESGGRHNDAVRLCLSYGSNGSNGAFGAFDAALERTVAVNNEAFRRVLASADRGLARAAWLAPLAAAIVVALVIAGFRPRLDEYRA